jgi:hypothetical protein
VNVPWGRISKGRNYIHTSAERPLKDIRLKMTVAMFAETSEVRQHFVDFLKGEVILSNSSRENQRTGTMHLYGKELCSHISLNPPETFTLKMETALFAETLENLQHPTQIFES